MVAGTKVNTAFQKKVYTAAPKRQFPWRQTSDPYKILVSEIMLQQTQAERVIPKYEAFIATFPTIFSLSQSNLSDVLSLWSGLGYNRRAKFLREAAIETVNNQNGAFSKDPNVLDGLPGVGAYTARAVVVFSYNIPFPFIETNIRRVYIHEFFSDRNEVTDKEILKFVEDTIDRKNPRKWFYALMDYGAILHKTVENPNRRSKHYTKQSKFNGSLRQVRGQIVKNLVTHQALHFEDLRNQIEGNIEFYEEALEQLITESFIALDGDIIRLK